MSRISDNFQESKNTNIVPILVAIIGILVAIPISVAVSVAVVFAMMKQPAFASAFNQTPSTSTLANSQLASSVQSDDDCTQPEVPKEQGQVLGASTTVAPTPTEQAVPPKNVHKSKKVVNNTTNNIVNHTEKKVYNDYSKTWNEKNIHNETNVAVNNTNVDIDNEVNIELGDGDKPKHHNKHWNKHDEKKPQTPDIDIDVNLNNNVDIDNTAINKNTEVDVEIDEVEIKAPHFEENYYEEA